MKRKILMIILCGVMVLGFTTGCDSEKSEEKDVNVNETNNTNNDSSDKEADSGKLTLENFKQIMQEMNLEVISKTPEDIPSANHVYTVDTDNNKTRYVFNNYKDEDIAKTQWNNSIKDYLPEGEVIVKKENDNSNRVEIKLPDGETQIYFRENNNILTVVVLNEAGEDGLERVKNALEKLGF